MTHPQHGAMYVYTEAEAVVNEKNGWIRSEIKKEEEVEEKEEVETGLVEQYEEKFGKKPHHRMNKSTIEAAIKE
jgi:hypothetical protein